MELGFNRLRDGGFPQSQAELLEKDFLCLGGGSLPEVVWSLRVSFDSIRKDHLFLSPRKPTVSVRGLFLTIGKHTSLGNQSGQQAEGPKERKKRV
ncbi:hypothetical protein Q3G72_008027 [Acer saccharum]|nr:hypothetical protein Q3G72_008027 [Acer saccharum]